MRKRVVFAVILFGLFSLAQQPSPRIEERVLVSLISKNGKQSTASDLSLKCDGKAALIKGVDPSGPIRFVLLFDTSNSGRDVFRVHQYGAIQLLRQLNPQDEGAVVTFDTTVNEDPQIIRDYQSFIPILEKARPGGGTSLFDALLLATASLHGGPTDRPRIIFLFSDGGDNQSRAREADVLDAVGREHVSVISFFEGDRAYSDSVAGNHLHHLAASGGEVLYPDGSEGGMKSSLLKVREYLNGLQWITYTPPPGTKNHAELELKAASAKVIAPKHCLL
jgi:hypothetical protein